LALIELTRAARRSIRLVLESLLAPDLEDALRLARHRLMREAPHDTRPSSAYVDWE
jgi:hypothetical protein